MERGLTRRCPGTVLEIDATPARELGGVLSGRSEALCEETKLCAFADCSSSRKSISSQTKRTRLRQYALRVEETKKNMLNDTEQRERNETRKHYFSQTNLSSSASPGGVVGVGRGRGA